ncbi:hypothetical protein AB0O42_07570 [Streptomyces sp. NPDC089922]|uniref:hypothetical protein n=1 Tax=Streptomyces sp. NPDC089922 TaxID=3155189 RepID=UPI0034168C85
MATRSTPETDLEQPSGRLSAQRRELAQDLARRVVVGLAPGEAQRFEQRARAHFRRRLPWRGHRTTRFDVLGVASELLTPTVLAVATALLGAVSTEVVGGLSRRARRRRRQAALPPEPPAAAPQPTVADLARWHAVALRAAPPRVPEELVRRVVDAALADLVRSLGGDTGPVLPGQPTGEVASGPAPAADPPQTPDPPRTPGPPGPPGPPAADGPRPTEG